MGMGNRVVKGIFLAAITVSLTGCLDKLLESICEKLLGKNMVNVVFNTSDPSTYAAKKVVVTYTDSNSRIFVIDECAGDLKGSFSGKFVGKNGSDGFVEFSIMIEEDSIFFDENGDLIKGQDAIYDVSIEWYENCNTSVASHTFNYEGQEIGWFDQITRQEEVGDDVVVDETDDIFQCEIGKMGVFKVDEPEEEPASPETE